MVEAFIKEWWFLIAYAIAFVAGYSQLKWRVAQAEKADVAHTDALASETQSRKSELIALELRLEKQRQEDMTQRKEDRDTTNAMIRDVQSDIKLLLQRTAK